MARFYAWADCSARLRQLGVRGSWDFAFEVMDRANIAFTPGRDFGPAEHVALRCAFQPPASTARVARTP
jgi:aspartate/methionine/tyrosine aminotransferase